MHIDTDETAFAELLVGNSATADGSGLLKTEAKAAIKGLKNGKSSGMHNITAEEITGIRANRSCTL